MIPPREPHEGAHLPQPRCKAPRLSPTRRSCPGLLDRVIITDTRLRPSRLSVIRPWNHHMNLMPITALEYASVERRRSNIASGQRLTVLQRKRCASCNAALVAYTACFRSLPSWTQHGKVFGHVNSDSCWMYFRRTHSVILVGCRIPRNLSGWLDQPSDASSTCKLVLAWPRWSRWFLIIYEYPIHMPTWR